MIFKHSFLITIVAALFWLAACENVEDGYRADYAETDAEFTVSLKTPGRGSIGDTISYAITANANTDIKSLIVTSDISGDAGSEFIVPMGGTDPLIDHVYGTIQPGTKNLNLVYRYIISQDSVDAKLTFKLIDSKGGKTIQQVIVTVPNIVKYTGIEMYTQTALKTDGFSSIDGVVYHNLQQYEAVSPVNELIQESLDIIFLVKDDTAMFAAPYNGNFNSKMAIRNKTLFKRIEGLSSGSFDTLTNAQLSEITEIKEIKKGSTLLWNVRMGDMIGFRTDFASLNPYHYGIIRINSIHPVTVNFYEGVSYVINMDITVQK